MTASRRRLPLLLLPGMLCSGRLWADLPQRLHGLVDARHVPLTAPSIEAMADEVLAQPVERFALAGLSLGGIVALEVVRRAPHRVAGLALLSTNARAPRPDQYAGWDQLEGMVDEGRFDDVTAERLLPSLVHPSRVQELGAEVVDMAREIGPDGFRAQLAAQRSREDYRGALGGISCPVTVVAAEADALCPPSTLAEIAALTPGSELRAVAGSGHLSPLERPGAVAAVLRDWLARGVA